MKLLSGAAAAAAAETDKKTLLEIPQGNLLSQSVGHSTLWHIIYSVYIILSSCNGYCFAIKYTVMVSDYLALEDNDVEFLTT